MNYKSTQKYIYTKKKKKKIHDLQGSRTIKQLYLFDSKDESATKQQIKIPITTIDQTTPMNIKYNSDKYI